MSAPKRYLTEWQCCHQAGGFCLGQEHRIPRVVGEGVIRAAAVLERCELVENALRDLIRRASDPGIDADMGAGLMLAQAIASAEAILAPAIPPGT